MCIHFSHYCSLNHLEQRHSILQGPSVLRFARDTSNRFAVGKTRFLTKPPRTAPVPYLSVWLFLRNPGWYHHFDSHDDTAQAFFTRSELFSNGSVSITFPAMNRISCPVSSFIWISTVRVFRLLTDTKWGLSVWK